jgi:NAD(P)H-dependent flavin oxidoreductase YrpB (nitropropane dioxygenase family)
MKAQTGASFADLLKTARGMTSHGGLTMAQAMSAAAVPMLIQRAVVDGKPDEGLMATGQVAGRLCDLPSCAELIEEIVTDARERLAALGVPAPTKRKVA